MISIISTYRNRRHHIEVTLPTWIDIKTDLGYEIVIVDYDTDDDVGELFKSLQSEVLIRHVRCEHLPTFNLSHARNIGANHAKGDRIMFVDIDTYLDAGAINFVGYFEKDQKYLAAVDSQVRKEIVNGGLLAVGLEQHKKIFGFNENIEGWGFEDIDYKRRLKSIGLEFFEMPQHIYTCIDHEDTERTQCYEEEKEISWTKNRQIALQIWRDPSYGQWGHMTVKEWRKE